MTSPARPAPRTASWLRVLAAVAVLLGGALHARLALDAYGTDDLITLFFMNTVGSALVAAWLVYDRRPLPLAAALGFAGVSLAAFGLSRVGEGVVGFRGVGLEPGPDALATLVVEGAAVVLIGAALLAERASVRTLVDQIVAASPGRVGRPR